MLIAFSQFIDPVFCCLVRNLGSNRLNLHEREMTDDYGHLIVGEPQIDNTLHEIENDDVRIVVLHHPFDWLVEFDRDRIERLLRENCHFILWSHLHSSIQSEILQAPEGDCVMISAGASYDRRKSSSNSYNFNGYNFVHLDFETGQGTVYFRRWSDRRNKWIQDIESSETGQYNPNFSPRFSKVAYKPCQISFSGGEQKKTVCHFAQSAENPVGVGVERFQPGLVRNPGYSVEYNQPITQRLTVAFSGCKQPLTKHQRFNYIPLQRAC